MGVLIVVESSFGNTRHIAEAIAVGLTEKKREPRIIRVDAAPLEIPRDVRLLLIGGPTHDHGMSTSGSRARMLAEGGELTPAIGVQDWIGHLTPSTDLPIRTFDTRSASKFLPSTARIAARELKHRGFLGAKTGESFLVIEGELPKIAEGEIERATEWGRQLAGQLRPF